MTRTTPAIPTHDMPARRRKRVLTRAAGALLLALAAVACDDSESGAPRAEIAGGGFIFNYRIAEAFYGITVRRLRAIEAGTILEAEFENPAGGAPIVVRHAVKTGQLQWMLRTPPLQGVEADRDYRVELRLVDPRTGEVLERSSRTFRSEVGQDVLPERPLTRGPGYHRNP